MIVHKTFTDSHLLYAGQRVRNKREALRAKAEAFIAHNLREEDVLCISESGDEYASSVTVWYRKR